MQHAHVLGSERQQQVLDAIPRQDRQRPLGAQPSIQEPLAETPRSGNGIRKCQASEGFTRRFVTRSAGRGRHASSVRPGAFPAHSSSRSVNVAG